MSVDRIDQRQIAEIRRLRAVMQDAQERYERVLQENPVDGPAAAESETALSEAHEAYDAHLSSFAGKLGA